MNDFVALRDVVKRYTRGQQNVEVLHRLNLEVGKGEFLALMGPSGSGKSTLLNLIGGLDSPSSGEVRVAGQRIDQLSGSSLARWRAQHVGFVFQFYHLMPMLNAQRNIELPLLLTSLSKDRRQRSVSAALRMVGLEERAGHRPSELSGGEAQRVAIARAIVSDPDLLVCDEPTGDLDRATADDILELLQILNREHGKTIVMVTHDRRAADYASRLVHLDKGVLLPSPRAAGLHVAGVA
jgi:putative ABC transport system ATP-binding protein